MKAAEAGVGKADLVLTGGVVYTVDPKGTVAEAVAVRSGRIVYVGDDAGARKLVGPGTELIELEGRMVLPGMIETHHHPPGTADVDLFSISLYEVMNDLDDTLATIRRFVEEHPDLDMYFGSGFSTGVFKGQEVSLGPRKERLDEISPDKPIFLTSYDGHISWVNSAALAYMGITKDTPDPEGGRIERDPVTGEPWGALKEAASWAIPANELTLEQRTEAMRLYQERMHSWGYTAILNMSGRTNHEEFGVLEREGDLRLRVRTAVALEPEGDLESEIQLLKDLRETYGSDLLKVTTAKFFADGVVEGVTAYLLEPYEEAADKGSDYYGEFLWDLDKLEEAFVRANQEGFQIHVHSIGDASTRKVLDALEYARARVPGDFRPTITHNQLVAREDIPRFKSLGVVASTQAGFWGLKEPDWWEVVDSPFLGERAEHEYPLASFFKAGVVVASSSDHPVTPIPNPLWAIEAGVTRNLNSADYYGVEDIADMDDPAYLLDAGERASLEQMIQSYTINGAYTLFMEKEIGSIEVGKHADLVVLGEDLRKVDPLRIDSVPILKTIFNGEVVYEAEE